MNIYEEVWEHLKDEATRIARDGRSVTMEAAERIVQATLQSFRLEQTPQDVRDYLASALIGFVEERRKPQ